MSMIKASFRRFVNPALVVAAFVFLPASAHAEMIRVAVFGDSLTSGYQLQPEDAYPAKLQRKLKEIGFSNFEVLNLASAGETTSGAVERVSSVLVRQPHIVVVELGGNDALRGINPDLIYRNLMSIVTRLRDNGVYVILMGVKAPASLGYDYGQHLDAVYEKVAGYNKIAFYPSALEGVIGQPELNLADGYHPNGKGVDVMVEGSYRLVDAALRWKMEDIRYREEYQKQWLERANGVAPGMPMIDRVPDASSVIPSEPPPRAQ